jgi:DNA-binding MarR family transcriptional regulator
VVTEQPGAEQVDSGQLDTELADAFGELVEQTIQRFEEIGRRFSLPAFAVKALNMLTSPMAMKELGQRFHCDPSFVTSIADLLDTHGLARRETDSKDRRIKNLMLTAKGLELRERLEREMTAIMPWTQALDESERRCLLGLLRKMIKAGQRNGTDGSPPASTARTASATSKASAAAKASATSEASATTAGAPLPPSAPHAVTGGNRVEEVRGEPTRAAPGGS